MKRKAPLIVINVANPTAFSGKGSMIVLECSDEEAALGLAQKIARETGRRVTVRKRKCARSVLYRHNPLRLAPAGGLSDGGTCLRKAPCLPVSLYAAV
jgi:hypothetical protein